MTDARHDYPADGVIGGTAELRDGLYERMCDEIDRLRAGSEAVLRKAVADSFRTIAEWGSVGVDVTREEMREIAEQVETGDVVNDWWSCPVCQETECDDGCPLAPLRKEL